MDLNLFWQVPLVLIVLYFSPALLYLTIGLSIRSVKGVFRFPYTCVDAYRCRRNINRALKEAEADE